MKTLFLLVPMALLAVSSFGQEAKIAPQTKPVEAVPATSKSLDAADFKRLAEINANLRLLGQQHRIKEYSEQADPLINEANSIVVKACASVGVAAKDVGTRCGVDSNGSAESPTGRVTWLPPDAPAAKAPPVDAKR